MKGCFSRYRLALFAISLASLTLSADQIWKETSVSDVVDEDLIIHGEVLLKAGGTTIQAINKDVKVTLECDAFIKGHWAGESQLYLIASEGHTIRFEIDHNITFTGSAAITGNNLLIVQSGPGSVEFAIQEGRKVALTSLDCSGGTNYYVLMYGGVDAPCDEYCCDEYERVFTCCDEYAPCDLFREEYCCNEEYCFPGSGINERSESRPTLRFVPLSGVSYGCNLNRRIIIGPNSRLGFLSSRKIDIAQDSGFIQFDPTVTCIGRMLLEICNGGAFVVSGQYTCQRQGACIRSEHIDPSTAAGFEAVWQISKESVRPDLSAGLLVLNRNRMLPELLVDPFLTNNAREDECEYRGSFCGQRYGLIIGANGTLSVGSDSFVDYVGLALNQLPGMITRADAQGQRLKMRNPSALFIDGNLNPNATNAQITFEPRSALFLRSGIAEDGSIRDEFDIDPFTVDASCYTRGVGNIVLDVEGELDVRGTLLDRNITSKIELLSLEVFHTGGSLFVERSGSNFPLRTFNTEDNELLQYNRGAFLINNQMNLYNTALSHTDESHAVFANNDLRSEPTYIGGETFRLLECGARPSINFFNSRLNIHTDIALTGVDLSVPNIVDEFGIMQPNISDFRFYSNGACVDNGTGRQMILGTRLGSTAADGVFRIDGDSYVRIVQEENALASSVSSNDPNGDQTLLLTTGSNDETINENASDLGTNSIHTIFLGNNSDIAIGTDADTTGFAYDSHPWLRIAGNVFSFEARGGAATVSRSPITGRNAMFVDLNGTVSIDPGYIANMGIMVIRSRNGVVDLPTEQVIFSNGAAITSRNVNLANPEDQIIIPAGETLSSYLFNWQRAQKDCPNFIPFNCCANACACPVTEENVTSLPTVQGTIDNFEIQAARLGDPVQFLIDGGLVRQLTFINSQTSAEAPVAVVALRNNGTLGLDGTTRLGANGTTIIADGSGTIQVNQDIIINNNCSIVRGPNFGECDRILFTSSVPRQITVQSSGVLNLSSFTQPTDVVEFGGELSLVLQPGAQVITGGGTLAFSGNARLEFAPASNVFSFFNAIAHGAHDETLPVTVVNASQVHNALSSLTNFGQDLANTNQFRVRLIGSGTIELRDNAVATVPFNAFVGVETLASDTCTIPTTDLTLSILDSAQFNIGRLNVEEGGVFQIGNVTDLGDNHIVNFTLTLDGNDAVFSIGSRGFFGLGVGISRFDGQPAAAQSVTRQPVCPVNFSMNENLVNTLFNVGNTTFNFLSGLFQHDRIFSGDNSNASLLAITGAEGPTFALNFETPNENVDPTLISESNFNIAGGGNIALVQPGEGSIHPVVLNQVGELTDRLTVGIMASSLLQPASEDLEGLTGEQLFDFFTTQDASDANSTRVNTFGRANVASQGDSFRPDAAAVRLGLVSQGEILRIEGFNILGNNQEDASMAAIDDAAVFVDIDPELNEVVSVSNIIQ